MLSHQTVSPVIYDNFNRHAHLGLLPQEQTNLSELGITMPPNHAARVGQFKTFTLPEKVTGSPTDVQIGKDMIDAWREDGILQVSMSPRQQDLCDKAFTASKRFFAKPPSEKAACVDTQSYSGYIASGEEITDGIADYSEIFTVTKDLPLDEPRVQAKWPCHGPCPWPDIDMRTATQSYMDSLGNSGETLLQLIEYGLGLDPSTLTSLTKDGWHHLRALR
jgi:isopenicillin N synthase-like dioxygenase